MADDLVEGLRVQVLSNRADSGLTRLTLLELLVELLLKRANIEARRWRRGHVLEPELPVLLVFVGRQDRVEVVLGLGRVGRGQRAGRRLRGRIVAGAGAHLAEGFGDEDWRFVLN